jgi:hypothetical protein
MPREAYIEKRFSPRSLELIAVAERICRQYAEQGFDLTLRQLYYQFVARDLLPNKQSEYKRLGSIVNDARLAGLLDWDYIVSRTGTARTRSSDLRPPATAPSGGPTSRTASRCGSRRTPSSV